MVPHVVTEQPLCGKPLGAVRTLKSLLCRIGTREKGKGVVRKQISKQREQHGEQQVRKRGGCSGAVTPLQAEIAGTNYKAKLNPSSCKDRSAPAHSLLALPVQELRRNHHTQRCNSAREPGEQTPALLQAPSRPPRQCWVPTAEQLWLQHCKACAAPPASSPPASAQRHSSGRSVSALPVTSEARTCPSPAAPFADSQQAALANHAAPPEAAHSRPSPAGRALRSSAVWRRMWSKNLVLLANIPPQVGQATTFSCVWLRKCSRSLQRPLKVQSQSEEKQESAVTIPHAAHDPRPDCVAGVLLLF